VLRTNLATRPFYNERAVHALIAAAAAIVLAIMLFNVARIVTLSRHNTDLSSRGNAQRAEAERLTSEAARIRRTIDKNELALVVSAAEEANALIDQRTFSWTEFFNQIEATLPPDVMLSSVRPSFKDGITHVNMLVLGRRPEDIAEFMEKLEAAGSFEEINAATADNTDEGLKRALIESVYVEQPPEEAAPADAKPAPPGTAPPGTSPPPPAAPAPVKPAAPTGRRGQQ
jgi:hypothetical protein